MSTSFTAWISDPRRTIEERFGGELLIENTLGAWRHKHGVQFQTNYEADRLRRKERALNPAHEPVCPPEDAARVEEVLGEIKKLEFGTWGDDRPLRDLSVLQFCPRLEELSLRHSAIRDWTPLAVVPDLRALHIMDQAGRDFRPVAQLTKLETLHLTPRAPWPDLTGFERLVALREFDFCGNVLALTVIPRLPALRAAKFHQWVGFNVPLRRVSDLPAMPELRRFFLENTCQLDGIERSPQLLSLEVFGYFDDLAPLTALPRLTHLFLSGGDYEVLAPLARLPELRRVVLRREEPLDCTPLADAPRLHEIAIELCPVPLAEAAAINSLLAPWSEEFAVEPPRPLGPLRLTVQEYKEHREDPAAQARDGSENKAMAASEAQWFAREVNRRLNRLLGKGWGKVNDRFSDYPSPGREHVRITRRQDIDRLREIAEALRELIASTRYPWSLFLVVDSLAEYERDLEEITGEDKEDEFDAESEREEWEDRRRRERERREFLEREYRFRLQKEQGMATRPQDFAPPPPGEETEEAVAAGFGEREQPEYDLGTELSLYSTLTETACYIREEDRGLAELLLETKAQE